MPWRETKQVRILAPGIGHAAFRHDRSKVRVRKNIHPGNGRRLSCRRGDDVFAPVRREPSYPVEEDRRLMRQFGNARRFGPMDACRYKAWNSYFRGRASVDLAGERPAAVGDDRAGNRLDENAILERNLLGNPYKNAAGAIDNVRFDTRSDQPHDLLLESLPVYVVMFVPDHEINSQSLETPIGVRLHELAHEVDVADIGNLQQYDRQVAGNRVSPEPGLPAAVPDENARGRAQRRVGVNHRAGEAAVELRVRLGGIELPQHHLAVCPGQLEDAIGETMILIFVDQTQRRIASVADA